MDRVARTRRPPRNRARVVCEACHTRKVKCDLQQQFGACSNCQRLDQTCRIRPSGSRLSVRGSSQVLARAQSFAHPRYCNQLAESPKSPNGFEGRSDSYSDTQFSRTYSKESIIPYSSPSVPVPVYRSSIPSRIQAEYLKLSGALDLPPKIMQEALKDNFFKYIYHRCAFVDREHLQNAPVLLTQAVNLAGSSMRQMSPEYASCCEHFYLKVKTLLLTNHEKDLRVILQSLCLLCSWNMTPLQVVGLDTAYNWLSTAIRLVFQSGLHREQTYTTVSQPGVLRRMAWYVFTLDKMYSSTLGLPCMMKPDDFEIRELGTKDFDTFDDEQELFIQFIRLNGLIAKMVEVCRRKGESDASQAAYSILRSLQEWIKQLPQRFRLYHDGDQRRYQREVYELHINYFIVIIKFFHLCGHAVHATITSPVALIASSCLSRLYEEILCREEIGYLLPVHNWFISVGSLPQIHALSRRFYSDDTCEEELGILRKALQTMGIKWPQAQNLRNAVDRLQKRRVATSKADQDRPDVAEAREGDYSEFLSYGHSSILNGFIRELFPFPQSMCPRISMLDSIDPVPGFGGNMDAGSLFLDEDYHLDWAMDLADIDGASGMYDNSSSLYHTGNSLNI